MEEEEEEEEEEEAEEEEEESTEDEDEEKFFPQLRSGYFCLCMYVSMYVCVCVRSYNTTP